MLTLYTGHPDHIDASIKGNSLVTLRSPRKKKKRLTMNVAPTTKQLIQQRLFDHYQEDSPQHVSGDVDLMTDINPQYLQIRRKSPRFYSRYDVLKQASLHYAGKKNDADKPASSTP